MDVRLYDVSMFRDKHPVRHRHVQLDQKTLAIATREEEAGASDMAAAQEQIRLNVANVFRIHFENMKWDTLVFTLLPVKGEGHVLGR